MAGDVEVHVLVDNILCEQLTRLSDRLAEAERLLAECVGGAKCTTLEGIGLYGIAACITAPRDVAKQQEWRDVAHGLEVRMLTETLK